MDNGRTYTAEQLAERAGVSLRTVRYYVQEGLIDAPDARGPGAHFTNTHLSQLLRIRGLQDAGFDLKTIKELGPSLETSAVALSKAALKAPELSAAIWKIVAAKAAARRRLAEQRQGEEGEDDDTQGDDGALDARTAVRIPMADGVELLVDPKRKMPSPKDLVEIALLIRKLFGER